MKFYGTIGDFTSAASGMQVEYNLYKKHKHKHTLIGATFWILTKDFKPVIEAVVTSETKTHLIFRGVDPAMFINNADLEFFICDQMEPDCFIFNNKYELAVKRYNREQTSDMEYRTYNGEDNHEMVKKHSNAEIILEIFMDEDAKECFAARQIGPGMSAGYSGGHIGYTMQDINFWDLEKYRKCRMTGMDTTASIPGSDAYEYEGMNHGSMGNHYGQIMATLTLIEYKVLRG